MPTPERSALLPRKKKWAKVADGTNAHQLFTHRCSIENNPENDYPGRVVFLIFKEWQPKENVIGQLSMEKGMRER
jgi:hypothetical protein